MAGGISQPAQVGLQRRQPPLQRFALRPFRSELRLELLKERGQLRGYGLGPLMGFVVLTLLRFEFTSERVFRCASFGCGLLTLTEGGE